MIIFETDRLLVRQYASADKNNFFLLNGNEDVVRYIRPPKTKEECDLFLQQVIEYYQMNPLYGRWAVEDKADKSFIGSFAIIPVESEEQMQLGYALLPGCWGRGYATELSKNGLKYVFSKTTIDPIFAYTDLLNQPSQKVLLKAGFKKSGNKVEGAKELASFILTKKDYLLLNRI